MLPSPRLIILVLGAAPIFLAAGLFDPLAVAGVIYLLGLLALAAVDAVFLPRRDAFAVERILPSRISLGEPAEVKLAVRNGTGRRLKVTVAEDLPEGMEALEHETGATVAPGAHATLTYRLVARRRGRYALSGLDVRLLPPYGLFCRQFRLSLPSEIHVFPNLVNLKRYDILLRRGALVEQGVARMRRIGQGSEFESLRRYAAGDEMARVEWKVTARRSRLIVKNFEPERRQNVLVALDAGRATASEFDGGSRLDTFINAALMLSYVVLRQGDWFSLLVFSDRIERYLPPVRRTKSIERVARVLYELEPRITEADYGGACRFLGLKHRKRSLICLMTDVIDREASGDMIGYMARFARYHLPLVVTCRDPAVHGLAEEPLARCRDVFAKAAAIDVLQAREEALASMRRLGVGVLDTDPADVLPELINRYLRIKAARRL